ncbi:conserved hypothetical protein [Rippkaea orientalis PCC 8801]|uniref:Capsular polysaccharide synthesis protein n=1 Tax=Rippkaea orientalis (strain PCC 8801 / RF-1) TaxID=41431 RepID=B7JZJ5_RIPO1|nr:putative capsular polysaccharide synthesis family protein [Rippkaea orientalis]ACK64155.1 conserved hypothetical protein [Rippkaea orientalis PCC 8801]
MIKKILKYPFHFIKDTYYYYQLVSRLSHEVRQPELILVHQMGKVGSSSIYKGLKKLNLGIPIYHTHVLNPKQLEDLRQKIKSYNYRRYGERVITELYLHKQIQQGLNGKTWKIITLVREPIGKNISDFFENLDNDVWYRNEYIGHKNVDELMEHFLNEFPHEAVLTWLDRHITNVFGIDILGKDFPKNKGYQIFKTDNIEILLIRMEDINLKIVEAMREFMNIENFTLSKVNIGDEKKYANKYQQFKQSINLPESYLNKMYNSKYTKHFYSENEIENFQVKWIRKV